MLPAMIHRNRGNSYQVYPARRANLSQPGLCSSCDRVQLSHHVWEL